MKKVFYKDYFFTVNEKGHCAIIYAKLTNCIVKCIAGDVFKADGKWSHNAEEKAMKFIDEKFYGIK